MNNGTYQGDSSRKWTKLQLPHFHCRPLLDKNEATKIEHIQKYGQSYMLQTMCVSASSLIPIQTEGVNQGRYSQ